MAKYVNEFNQMDNLYTKLIEIKNINIKGNKLNNDDAKFIDKIILNFQRNGILLDNHEKKLLLKINHEISKLENGIMLQLNKFENDYIELTTEQMQGVPFNITNTYEKKHNIFNCSREKSIYFLRRIGKKF